MRDDEREREAWLAAECPGCGASMEVAWQEMFHWPPGTILKRDKGRNVNIYGTVFHCVGPEGLTAGSSGSSYRVNRCPWSRDLLLAWQYRMLDAAGRAKLMGLTI